MDYSFVYALTDIVRRLNEHFSKIDTLRFLILTHNAEFMAALINNKVSKKNLFLKDGKLSVIKDELLMPYKYHLADIKKISNGIATPNHTTANSVRHVLETIMRFDDPTNNSLLDYISQNQTLNENQYIYGYMNDLSHGMYRMEKTITDIEIKSICDTVCQFISERFPKQLETV